MSQYVNNHKKKPPYSTFPDIRILCQVFPMPGTAANHLFYSQMIVIVELRQGTVLDDSAI